MCLWINIIKKFQNFTLNIYLFKTQLITKTSQIIHNNLVTNVKLLTEVELCIISAVPNEELNSKQLFAVH